MKNFQCFIGSLICMCLGARASWGGMNLKLFDLGVPASGLFPFLFGTVLFLIGIVSLCFDLLRIKASLSEEDDASINYKGVRKVFLYFGLSISCTLLIPYFGFVIPAFGLLFVLLRFVENVNWRQSLYLAFGFTMFCDILFIRTLGVQLQSFNI